MSIPYTYLIGWPELNLWYYGVRYARGCHPKDFWVSYKTSSDRVKKIVKEHGEPPVRTIRKTFSDEKTARLWEFRVLTKMKVVAKDQWINGNTGIAFDPKCRSRGDDHHMRQPGGSDYIKGKNNPMANPETAKKFSGQNHWINRRENAFDVYENGVHPFRRPEVAQKTAEKSRVRMTENNPMKNPEVVAKFRGENSASKRQEVRDKIRASVLKRIAEKKAKLG
jgi:hypothetical protein